VYVNSDFNILEAETMHIKTAEALTGITKRNIRFYEKSLLLNPGRNTENQYRHYSDEDVNTLKQIKLLRKLGVSISDIKDIQDGNVSLNECLQKYSDFFAQQIIEFEKMMDVCTELQKNETTLQMVNTDYYLNKIETLEKNGTKFINIARDFFNKAKGIIPKHAQIFFEPDEPIINHLDFMKELEKYAERKGLDITFVSVGMNPTILLGGKAYKCALEMPRMLNFPLSLFFVFNYNYGFRWVYLYEDFGVEVF